METAKVDVRKLQMLNDRINQTIDALNQVRLSVHGMSTNGNGTFANGTTPFTTPFVGATFPGVHPGIAAGAIPGIGWTHPAQAQTWQHLQHLQALQQMQQLQQLQYGIPGAQAFGTNPYAFASNSYATNPYLTNPYGTNPYATNPYVTNPYFSSFANGLGANPFSAINSFSAVNPFSAVTGNVYADPFVGNRISQTFPFVQWGYSPLGSGNWPSASQVS
jgi:hypothetical protein